ncbi:MAG: hypothetical protein IJC92_01855 [Bacteroidaceae bacterium]|jgi:hypothetical protein|nr:hypothetical protein [Bacteroidaceae bacterium]
MINELDLKNPFDGISNYESFKAKCRDIAGELFTSYGIECNNKIFRLAEIEFYYYDSEQYLKDPSHHKWQEVTYPRNDYKGGELFYHLSGIDICFDSQYNEESGRFGGILIRSIKDGDKIIAGPLNCKDEILNACKNGEMPKLIEVSGKQEIEPAQTYRSLGKTGTDTHDGLCFYDASIKKGNWNPKRDRFDTKTGNTESKKSSYNTSKFMSV